MLASHLTPLPSDRASFSVKGRRETCRASKPHVLHLFPWHLVPHTPQLVCGVWSCCEHWCVVSLRQALWWIPWMLSLGQLWGEESPRWLDSLAFLPAACTGFPLAHVLLSTVVPVVFLIRTRWSLNVVFTYMSLMAGEVGHLFTCLSAFCLLSFRSVCSFPWTIYWLRCRENTSRYWDRPALSE